MNASPTTHPRHPSHTRESGYRRPLWDESELSSTDQAAIAGIQGSTRFHDGTSSDAGSTTFNGTIDEVAVYNGVLSAQQVLRHWAAGT